MAILTFPHDKVGRPQRNTYSVQEASSISITQGGRGTPSARLVDTNFMNKTQLTWYMSNSQFQEFEYTWETLLRYGEYPVLMDIFTGVGYESKYVYITQYTMSTISSTLLNVSMVVNIDNGSLGQ